MKVQNPLLYVQGTWVPDLQFNALKVGITYFFQSGRFIKVGNTVIATGQIGLISKGTSNGNANIKGLPYANGTSIYPVVVVPSVAEANSIPGVALSNISGFITGSGSSITLLKTLVANGTSAFVTDADFVGTEYFQVMAIYTTA